MENLDLGDQLEDLMICHDEASDKSIDTWKTGPELHEDDETIFSSFNSKFDNRYQVLAIVGDNSEEFDENNNPILNPANVNRGANHLAEGETADSLASKEKVRLSVEDWKIIKMAVEHGVPIPTDASKKHVVRVSLCLKTAIKATSKRKKQDTKKKKIQPLQQAQLFIKHAATRKYTNSKRHHRHGSRVENLEY
jgi:hypothetical protein